MKNRLNVDQNNQNRSQIAISISPKLKVVLNSSMPTSKTQKLINPTNKNNQRTFSTQSKCQNLMNYHDFLNLIPNRDTLTDILTSNKQKEALDNVPQQGLQIRSNTLIAAYFDCQSACIYLILKKQGNNSAYYRQLDFPIMGRVNYQTVKLKVLNHSRNIRHFPNSTLYKISNSNGSYQQGPCYQIDNSNKVTNCVTIQFNLTKDDIEKGVHLSMYRPYAISRLNSLQSLDNIIASEQIGKTIKGNPIYCFKIGSKGQSNAKSNIIVLARQHPCENISSFICQKILMDINKRAMDGKLKDVKWHIIPIVNPDGVQLNNTRSNLQGYDVNRCWAPHLFKHSQQTASVSAYFRKIGLKNNDIVVDLHGHSQQFGCFTYCTTKNQWNTRFNTIMAEKCQFFKENQCIYGMPEAKKNCLRNYLHRIFNIQKFITLETSLNGYEEGTEINKFHNEHIQKIANSIVNTIEQLVKVQASVYEPLKQKDMDKIMTEQIPISHKQNPKLFIRNRERKDKNVSIIRGFSAKSYKTYENHRTQKTPNNLQNKKQSKQVGRQIRSSSSKSYYSIKNMIGNSENMILPRKKRQNTQAQTPFVPNSFSISKQTLTLPNWNQYEDVWSEKLKIFNAEALKKKMKNRHISQNLQKYKKKKDLNQRIQKIQVSVSQIMKLIN